MTVAASANPTRAVHAWRWRGGIVGVMLLVIVAAPCLVLAPWSLQWYDLQRLSEQVPLSGPSLAEPMGTDVLGRSLLWRTLAGGAVSLTIGVAAALIAVIIGTTWGMVAGFAGGRLDATMMRIVDVFYGLPYILLVVLIDLSLQPIMAGLLGGWMEAEVATNVAGIVTLLVAIGGVSWLTMARVIRGQVLSLRAQPFVEAARAMGATTPSILVRHLLPNLVGPIIVYATLAVPQAILQESFLSFLGIGVRPPLPSWGRLASDGLSQLYTLANDPAASHWWLLVFPCLLLGVTLFGLNLVGDALRDRLDPRQARVRRPR